MAAPGKNHTPSLFSSRSINAFSFFTSRSVFFACTASSRAAQAARAAGVFIVQGSLYSSSFFRSSGGQTMYPTLRPVRAWNFVMERRTAM